MERGLLSNVPANFGQVRARATCVENGITTSGQSDLFVFQSTSTAVRIPQITFGDAHPIPASLALSTPTTTLTTAGATTQIIVTARYPDGSTQNVSASSTGTSYTNSNTRVATVSSDGLVTAVSSGTVIISALHEGALGLIRIQARVNALKLHSQQYLKQVVRIECTREPLAGQTFGAGLLA